jgi:hypothetical protein
MQKISISKKLSTFLSLIILITIIGYISYGINFTDSYSLTLWALERENETKNFTTFLDYYWLIGANESVNVYIFNVILLGAVILILLNIARPNLYIYFLLMPYACLLSVISKEIFFLLGISILFYSHYSLIGLKKLVFFFISAYFLIITKQSLAIIYIIAYFLSRINAKISYLIAFILSIIITELDIYLQYKIDYFGNGGAYEISKQFSNNLPLDWIVRFFANILSPIYILLLGSLEIINTTNYQFYVFQCIIALFYIITLLIMKCKNIKLLEKYEIKYFIIVNIMISVLIPFVQTRYIIAASLPIVFVFIKEYAK